MAKAVFRCQECMNIAATVELAVPSDAPAGELILEGFLWKRNTETIKGRTVQLVHQALATHDVRLLHTLNQLWAPFYCPQCERVYCLKHWHITPRFDDDLPGRYDSSYGTCPQGHRRLVDE
jgi:hypothetical protein